MLYKSVAVLCLVLALVYADNYSWGYRQHNDRLLDRKFAIKSSSFARVVTVDVFYPNKTVSFTVKCFPETYFINLLLVGCFQMNATRSNITYINVQDQKANGTGGYATLISGGVGFNYTGLHLKSRRNHGINFIVDIYGV